MATPPPLNPTPPPLPQAPQSNPASNSAPPPGAASPAVSLPVPGSSAPVTPPPAPAAPTPTPPPLPTPQQPAQPNLEDRAEDEIQALSPFKVMQPKSERPQAPVTPSREDLIKQAAATSPTQFIVPESTVIEPDPTPPPRPAAAPTPTPPPLPTGPGMQPAPAPRPVPPPASPAPLVGPGQTFPMRGGAAAAPAPRPVPAQVLSDVPVKPNRAAASGRSTSPIIAIGIGVIVLALIGGGTYVAALVAGVRIPVIYPLASGLKTGGLAVGKDALAYVNGKSTYQAYGDITIKTTADNSKPTLPATDTSAKAQISTLKGSFSSASPMQYNVKDKHVIGKVGLTIDSGATAGSPELPLYMHTGLGDSVEKWLVNVPSNTVSPLENVPQADLKQTLLFSALQPIPLPEILASIKTETAYQKVSGQQIAHYTYDLNPDNFGALFPDGAKITTLKADVYYAWKTKQPLQTMVDGSFTYADRTYQIQELFAYQKWDESLVTDNDSYLTEIADGSGSSVAADVTIQDFISQLGTTIAAMPTTLDITQVVAIKPTGLTISATADAIKVAPPVPVTPATTEGKARDTQRLSDLADLKKALQGYKTAVGNYPIVSILEQTRSSKTLLAALVPTYLTAMPVDPLQETYWYEYVSDGTTFTLRSIAEDTTNTAAKAGKAYSYFEVTDKN